MILVTGATGYIGSHLVYRLMELGHNVVCIDNYSNSDAGVCTTLHNVSVKNKWPRPIFHKVDITNEEAVYSLFLKYDIDVVFHFAAWKSVPQSVARPIQYYKNNVGGLINMLTMSQGSPIEKFIFSSSCAVYEQVETYSVYREDMETVPASPYGQTKLMCERILADYSVQAPDFKVVNLRYFNPIGAHPSGLIGERQKEIRNLMPMLCEVAAGKMPAATIYGNDYRTKDGTAIRDYIDIMDLVDGHIAALDYLDNDGVNNTVNLGTGHGYTVGEVVRTFSGASNVHFQNEYLPRRPGDMQSLVADTTKAKAVLGWEPSRSLYDSCASAWKWRQSWK